MLLILEVFFIFGINGLTMGQFSGKNIALNKPATQFPGDHCSSFMCYTASLAVDGAVDAPDTWMGHCTHTFVQSDSYAFWNVDFGGFHHISGIRITNRTPEKWNGWILGDRLRNFTLYGTSGDPARRQLLYTYDYIFADYNYPRIIEIALNNTRFFSGIRIEIPHRQPPENTILTLCEVEVYSGYSEECTEEISTSQFKDSTCPGFQLDTNMDAFITKNGGNATFSCVDGFNLSEQKTLGCYGTYWYPYIPPTCNKVYCQLPSDVENMQYSVSQQCLSSAINGSLPYSCSITPICDPGYNLTQRVVRYCQASGNWSGQEPVCHLIKCSSPAEVPNGVYILSSGLTIGHDHVVNGTEILLKCNIGFLANNAITRVCQRDGSWSGTNSECNSVRCNHPGRDSVLNGYLTDASGYLFLSGHMNYSQSIHVLCIPGYKLSKGSERRTCQSDGSWNGTKAECTVVTCPPLDYFYNVSSSYLNRSTNQLYTVGSAVVLSCENGLIQEVRRCADNGTWDGMQSSCRNGTLPLGDMKFDRAGTNIDALTGGFSAAVALLLVTCAVLIVIILRMRVQKKEDKQDYTSLTMPRISVRNEYDTITETVLSVGIETKPVQNTGENSDRCKTEYKNLTLDKPVTELP